MQNSPKVLFRVHSILAQSSSLYDTLTLSAEATQQFDEEDSRLRSARQRKTCRKKSTFYRPRGPSYAVETRRILAMCTLAAHLCVHGVCDDLPGLLAESSRLGPGVGRRRVGVAIEGEYFVAHEGFDGFQRTSARRPVSICHHQCPSVKAKIMARAWIIQVVDGGCFKG